MGINNQKLQAINTNAVKQKALLGPTGETILAIFLPAIEAIAIASLTEMLETFHKQNPQGYEASLMGIYPPIDIHLETLAKKSKTKFDDTFVRIFKQTLEASAQINDIKLPNLDKD